MEAIGARLRINSVHLSVIWLVGTYAVSALYDGPPGHTAVCYGSISCGRGPASLPAGIQRPGGLLLVVITYI